MYYCNFIFSGFLLIPSPCLVFGNGPSRATGTGPVSTPGPGPNLVPIFHPGPGPVSGPDPGPVKFLVQALVPVTVLVKFFGPVTQ